MIDHFRRLFAHMEWADGRVLDGLARDPGSDPKSLEYFAHVLGAEEVWLSRIEQRAAQAAVWPTLTLDECAKLAAHIHRGFAALLDRSSEADLARGITYRNSAGAGFTTRLDDILYHVALHGSYHRGQVSLTVRRAGGTPTPTDYIAFVRGAPAATTADSERGAARDAGRGHGS
jgi:uncharacterized damage-inducible protein DinB